MVGVTVVGGRWSVVVAGWWVVVLYYAIKSYSGLSPESVATHVSSLEIYILPHFLKQLLQIWSGDNQCCRIQSSRQIFDILRSSQDISDQTLMYLSSTSH